MGSAPTAQPGDQLVCRSGSAISAVLGVIRLPHGCRWASTWPAAAFLGGFDGADNGTSSSGGLPPRTQRLFHHFSYRRLRVAEILSGRKKDEHVDRWRTRVAGAALLAPQGRRSRWGSRLLRQRCAASHARVRACLRTLSVCCLSARRTVVVLSLGSEHGPGGYRYELFEQRAALRGHVAAGGRDEERERAARAMCTCVGMSNGMGTSGSRTRVQLRVRQ